MREELDKKLVEKFPKLFRNRYAPMTETCMCWGFSHGDGWFNIINALCSNIQHHIDWKRGQRASALRYNRALARAIREKNIAPLLYYYTRELEDKEPNKWNIQNAEEALANEGPFREVPEKVSQVVVDQVKEKFGTLRFYYHGGDEAIDGMVRMAESMSACTCESCGVPGTIGGRGWVSTLCTSCREKHESRYKDSEEDIFVVENDEDEV